MAAAYTIRYAITVEAMVDAGRLYSATVYRVMTMGGGLVLLSALVMGAISVAFNGIDGFLWFGLALVGMFLLLIQSRAASTWVTRRKGGSLVGGINELTFDETGVSFTSPAASGLVRWHQVTGVREDARTVLFLREKVLSFWIPASAFADAAERTEILRFAREHMVAARPA